MTFDSSKNINNDEAHAIIRACTTNGTLTLSGHARKRMRERGYTMHDIIYIIQFGKISKKEFNKKTKSWVYTIEGNDLDNDSGGIVATITKIKTTVLITLLS